MPSGGQSPHLRAAARSPSRSLGRGQRARLGRGEIPRSHRAGGRQGPVRPQQPVLSPSPGKSAQPPWAGVPGYPPPTGPASLRSAAPRATGSGRALGGGTRRSGSHSVRQWRRREDEQQVRRVSGVRPPPGAPSPNRSPHPSRPRLAAAPAPRRRAPSRVRAAGWSPPRRPAGRRGARVPGTPRQSGPGRGAGDGRRVVVPPGRRFSDAPPRRVRVASGVEG